MTLEQAAAEYRKAWEKWRKSEFWSTDDNGPVSTEIQMAAAKERLLAIARGETK